MFPLVVVRYTLRTAFALVRPVMLGSTHLVSDAAEEEVVGSLRELCQKIKRNYHQRVPVEYGNLRASSFFEQDIQPEHGGAFEVGYTASYAVYVHENLEMKWAGKPRGSGIGVYWGPHGESKFLEKAFHEETSKLHMEEVMSKFFKSGGIEFKFGGR
jgi:hypothetical protein